MSAVPAKNPYVGLRPFESEDSLYYFGRRQQSKELLRQLHSTRFLAVVGSSGSGKSSLVRAGLIPSLEAGFLAQERDFWRIAKMKPGDAPLDNLAWTLLSSTSQPCIEDRAKLFGEDIRRQGIQAVVDYVKAQTEFQDANLLLLVDQFEEVFRFAKNNRENLNEAADLVAIMLGLSEQSVYPVFVCMTMRSDFLGDCDMFYGLPEAMNRSQYLVPRLTRSQRREAIASPVRLCGETITRRLLDRLLNENIDTRDDLPVLQHALLRTWEEWAKRGSGPIDVEHYEAICTIKQALDRHANEALEEMSDQEKSIAKHLFQTLTETDAGNRRIRRPAHLSEVATISGVSTEEVRRVISKFNEHGRAFLVLSEGVSIGDPLIDISHESLIRQWQALREWVDEEAESARIYKRLAQTADLYPEKAGLYHDIDLQVALDWRETTGPTAAWGQRYHSGFDNAIRFLELSREKREKDEEARTRALREKAIQQAKTLRMTRFFMIGIGVLMLVAFYAAWLADKSRNEALQSTMAANFNLAKAFEEKANSTLDLAKQSKRSNDYRDTWFFTTAALNQKVPEDKLILRPESAGRLLDPEILQKAFAQRWVSSSSLSDAPVNAVSLGGDGKLIASASTDNTIRLWDPLKGAIIFTLEGHLDDITDIAFSPTQNILASASKDHTIRLWDSKSGELTKKLTEPDLEFWAIAFNPDGQTLASDSKDGAIRIWNLENGRIAAKLSQGSTTFPALSFSPTGDLLASISSDRTINIWDIRGQKILRTLRGHADEIVSIEFSPNGDALLSGSYDKTMKLWDIESGRVIETFGMRRPDEGFIYDVAFSPLGHLVASASDKAVYIWNIENAKPVQILEGHDDIVHSIGFSLDGKMLASASADHTLRLWDIVEPTEHKLAGHQEGVRGVAISSDGHYIVSGSTDETLFLWDKESGKILDKVDNIGSAIFSVAHSPDGTLLASGSGDNMVRLWHGTDEKLKIKAALAGHSDTIYSVAFSPDGTTLASGSSDLSIGLWNIKGEKLERYLKGHTSGVYSVAFGPDSKTLVSGSWDNTVRLWDVDSGTELGKLEGHTNTVLSVGFSSDGKRVASGSADNTVRIWDTENGNGMGVLEGNGGNVYSVLFSQDGDSLISGSADNRIRIWDIESKRVLRILDDHTASIQSLALSADGQTLISGSMDKSIRVWDLSVFNKIMPKGKPSKIFDSIARGSRFLSGVELYGLEFRQHDVPTIKDQDGYYFQYDRKFRPLLNPPIEGENKFDQLVNWAETQTE